MSLLEKCWFGSAHFLIVLFVFPILTYTRCLWILDINLLSFASFASTFSHSIGCLLVLLIVSHAVLKLLNLIMCHLFPPALANWLKENIATILSEFYVSCFTLRLLHHLSLFYTCNLFLYMVLSNFTVLYVAVQLLKHHLLKRLSPSPLSLLAFFVIG